MSRLSSFIIRHRKGVIIYSVIAALLLIAGGYGLWSMHTWGQFETGYASWNNNTKQQAATALALPVKNDQDRQRKLAALKAVSNSVASAKNTLCEVNTFMRWQQSIDSLKTKVDDCNKVIDRQAVFGTKLQVVTTYLENEQALAKIIAKNNTPTELAEADWGAQPGLWQTTVKSVSDLSTHTSFTSVKGVAVKQVSDLEAAWKELVAAHQAKDKARFIKAQSQLVQGYAALGEIALASSQQFQKLIGQLPAIN